MGIHIVCVPRGGDIKTTQGTKFQKMVWQEIAKIPFGKTISYKELARRVGHPKSCRAVANACGANPHPVKIPCHRVIASDGSIGGFSLGVEKKIALLKKEGVTFP